MRYSPSVAQRLDADLRAVAWSVVVTWHRVHGFTRRSTTSPIAIVSTWSSSNGGKPVDHDVRPEPVHRQRARARARRAAR